MGIRRLAFWRKQSDVAVRATVAKARSRLAFCRACGTQLPFFYPACIRCGESAASSARSEVGTAVQRMDGLLSDLRRSSPGSGRQLQGRGSLRQHIRDIGAN